MDDVEGDSIRQWPLEVDYDSVDQVTWSQTNDYDDDPCRCAD